MVLAADMELILVGRENKTIKEIYLTNSCKTSRSVSVVSLQ
jgi:hypothetical protein